MAKNYLKQLLVFVAAVLTGCSTNMDYYIVGTGTEIETEIVYETVYDMTTLSTNEKKKGAVTKGKNDCVSLRNQSSNR